MPVVNNPALIDNRVSAIQDFHRSLGNMKAELDVSGGIDSAVMVCLLARALGPENVIAVYSSIHSSAQSALHAEMACAHAGVKLIKLDLSPFFDGLTSHLMAQSVVTGYDAVEMTQRIDGDATVLGSFRSCIRAPIGRFMNRLHGGAIRHGTGNEDEDRWLRFFQKGGDGEVDTNPMAMLTKGEVRQLAVTLGLPAAIIDQTPTPDLWGTGDAHNDEEELSKLSGVEWTYSKVDPKTGEYTYVGTIEKMSRLLDHFSVTILTHHYLDVTSEMMEDARSLGLTLDHIRSARKWERATRHKFNPNIPTLGTREELIAAGILSDTLPAIQ